MQTAFFSIRQYEKPLFAALMQEKSYPATFFEPHLNEQTASLAHGHEAVCTFVNDHLNETVLEILKNGGVRLIALRCAGFNQIDLQAAEKLGLCVVRVPAYSPHAVAEHSIALLLALNRKVHRAYNRIRESNFSLEGLCGMDLFGKTAGVIGTGKIGQCVARILNGFGCRVLACDPYPCEDLIRRGISYVGFEALMQESDIITLHCPLNPKSHHLIDDTAIEKMKNGVFLINTSRGALIDTRAVIDGLKKGKIGQLGLDVYEEEGDLFFEDLSSQVIQDDVFARLTTFPNVIITGHQAFLTREALNNIAHTTVGNIAEFARSGQCENRVVP